MNRTIGVVSLGCSKNLVDTERMLGLLSEAGFTLTDDANEADILIVNTCGFILPAKQESIDTILDLAEYKKKGKCETLVVTGCLTQRYKDELALEMPEIDILLGVNEYEKLPSLLRGDDYTPTASSRVLTTPFYSAYLRIADGCDNRCSYCAIPSIRGAFRSTPIEALVFEAQTLLDKGVTELTLIAQDTSAYGRDIYGELKLIDLMERLTRLEGLHWLRLLYTYPDTVTRELIEYMATNKKICDYLDMPLQHINDTMLHSMNRRGNKEHIKRIYEYIRSCAPGFILRTTVMTGFPGETDGQFGELLRFLEDYPFDRVGAFMFSPEEGTPASRLPGQIGENTKRDRLDAIMRLQRGISLSRNEKRLGTEVEALIISAGEKGVLARSYAEAPEVDGHILLDNIDGIEPGTYTKVKLTHAGIYDMEGEIV